MYIMFTFVYNMGKKLIITAIVGTIAYFAFGWLVFDFVLGNYTDLHTTQLNGFKKNGEQSSLALLIVSCGAYALLLSFILVYLLNITDIWKASLIAAIIGVLIAIMTDSYWYATSTFYSNSMVVIFDVLAAGITVGFMGLIIAFTNKKLN